ncbi:UDP-N-acetylmuramoyl-tripeptide--D-alanyl-D-alanine ligase [Chromobacterium piscinae]|uniref:UDP-N-acetylmuramoyl-tripeptide--D-alanyl-D- alanine ligase n=1 Tax=Chromobacterium piscinae TaxID=686831 RepID=UPI003557AF1C
MMTLSQAARFAQGRLIGADGEVLRVITDSRQAQPGDLFVALKGERFDAHDFVAEVTSKGAAALVRDGFELAGASLIQAGEDTRLALGRLAAGWRETQPAVRIGVTGSNGKTTVKEMLAAILRAHAGVDAVLATAGNFNNDIGLPLTLLQLKPQHRYAVIEMGMNHHGELSYLTGLTRPQVALVNNAMRAHFGHFGSTEDVARAKAEIFEGLADGGVAVVNADDANLPLFRAAAVALALDVPLSAIAAGLAVFGGAKGRLQIKQSPRGLTVIDDSYNANPDSMKAGIDVLAGLPGPHCFVMGDIGELGEASPALHAEVGEHARLRGIEQLFALGEASRRAVAAFGAAGQGFDSIDELLECLDSRLASGTAVLVKGSRFMRMERVVEHLMQAKKEGV